MTHPYPVHGVAYAVSGIPTYTPALETRPRDPRHWPFIGSVVDYLEAKRTGDPTPAVPRNVGLPWLLNSKTDLPSSAPARTPRSWARATTRSGPTSTARARRSPRSTPTARRRTFHRPVRGVRRSTGRFRLSTHRRASADVPVARLDDRRSLLAQFDAARAGSTRPAARHRQAPRDGVLAAHHRARCARRSTSAASRWRCASATA